MTAYATRSRFFRKVILKLPPCPFGQGFRGARLPYLRCPLFPCPRPCDLLAGWERRVGPEKWGCRFTVRSRTTGDGCALGRGGADSVVLAGASFAGLRDTGGEAGELLSTGGISRCVLDCECNAAA